MYISNGNEMFIVSDESSFGAIGVLLRSSNDLSVLLAYSSL